MPIVPVDSGSRRGFPFAAEDRAIFHYGGGLDLRGDPLAIEARYNEALLDINPSAVASWLKQRNPNVHLLAYRRLIPVVHRAMGTAPLDERTGAGLTGDEAMALLDRFFAFRDRLTRAYREDAELLATYGEIVPRQKSYARLVGLWWNRHRAQALAGIATFRGVTAAMGGPLHQTLADAQAGSRAEAEEIAERYEADRPQAAALAKAAACGGR